MRRAGTLGPLGAGAAIRRAVPADLDAVSSLEEASFPADRISRRSFARFLNRPSAAVLVAEEGRAILGCAVVLFRLFSRRARLYSLAVDARAEGQGLGGRLLDAAEHAVRQKGCDAISLEVRADNTRAIGLYESRDFRLIGRSEDFYADGAIALHYLKRLCGSGSNGSAA